MPFINVHIYTHVCKMAQRQLALEARVKCNQETFVSLPLSLSLCLSLYIYMCTSVYMCVCVCVAPLSTLLRL